MSELSKSQVARKKELIAVVKQGLQTYVEVGCALMALKAESLWKGSGYKTFEAFVAGEFELQRGMAYRYIRAAELHNKLSTVLDKEECPRLESHYRVLSDLPVDQVPEVVKRANDMARVEDKRPTARHYKEAKSAVDSVPVKPKPAPVPPNKEEPAQPPAEAPVLSTDEKASHERKKARSYAEYLQRSVDDLNHLKRNPHLHAELISYCARILKGLERW